MIERHDPQHTHGGHGSAPRAEAEGLPAKPGYPEHPEDSQIVLE